MFYKTAKIGAQEQENLALHKATTFFKSRFGFLKQHNGFRPSDKHLFIAPTGGGKSTLRNSIIVDIMQNTHARVLLYLSEESAEKFQTDMACGFLRDVDPERIFIISEPDLAADEYDFNDLELIAEELKTTIFQTKSNVLIFDNLTTSTFYGEKPAQQQRVFTFLSNMGKSIKFTGIYFAHTSPGVSRYQSKLQDTDDIRGTRMTVNKSEFAYSVQQFQVSDENNRNKGLNTVINCIKVRDYNKENDFFCFQFSGRKRLYIGDIAIKFEKIKELFKAKDSL